MTTPLRPARFLLIAASLALLFGGQRATSQSPAPVGENATATPALPPIIYLDETKASPRKGHSVHALLGPPRGTANQFDSFVGVYTDTEFVVTGTHTFQEMFYVTEGTGTALVGDREFSIRPGACWIVKPGEVHGIKRDASCAHVKAFFVHGAP